MVIPTYLDRRRDVLLAFGDPAPLHRDLDLHLLSNGITYDDFTCGVVRNGLSALALIMASRPRFVTFGWTLNLQSPARNFFWTGAAGENTVAGRAFLENVQEGPRNLFFVQTSRSFGDLQTLVHRGGGHGRLLRRRAVLRAIRPAAGAVLQPRRSGRALDGLSDADRDWVRAVETAEVFAGEGTPTSIFIGEREVIFRCGCDRDRIASILATLYEDAEEDLFQGDAEVEAECPRCGAKHVIARELFREAGPRGGARQG